MPDIAWSKEINGRLYCWNARKEAFVEIKQAPIRSAGVLQEVAAAYIKDISALKESEENT